MGLSAAHSRPAPPRPRYAAAADELLRLRKEGEVIEALKEALTDVVRRGGGGGVGW
jgi:hypothetical protein